ncbi:hypothetical protein QBC38DRAFT_505523 [Podospora fimiseda]|uniref:Uncharacterized protein n=1 Tax=Podospora fimiseda TaxID=252190 RepID=A0AAN6YLQ3_9PEZI|nr:hypothetical protein QBC38DRAFT_505523 [Podospora fimiseda]
MPSFKNIVLALAAFAQVTLGSIIPRDDADITAPAHPLACGQINIVFTGIPPRHPLVTKEGFNPDMIDKALRADLDIITKAGYNVRIVLFGPEEPITTLAENMKDLNWDGAGVGYGVRAANADEMTIRFEDIISLYRQHVPTGPFMFNSSPSSGFLPAIQRHFPLKTNCAQSPGRNLGYVVVCSDDVCKK